MADETLLIGTHPVMHIYGHLLPHLLLVFSLGVQTGLNAFSCLLEGLPL